MERREERVFGGEEEDMRVEKRPGEKGRRGGWREG